MLQHTQTFNRRFQRTTSASILIPRRLHPSDSHQPFANVLQHAGPVSTVVRQPETAVTEAGPGTTSDGQCNTSKQHSDQPRKVFCQGHPQVPPGRWWSCRAAREHETHGVPFQPIALPASSDEIRDGKRVQRTVGAPPCRSVFIKEMSPILSSTALQRRTC